LKVLITGICGFVGSSVAKALLNLDANLEISGIDNMSRAGTHVNKKALQKMGLKIIHGDIRSQTDLALLETADWIIDAAANPSVMAGTSGYGSSRQLVENNLLGTINIVELAAKNKSGFILLSTSRVYSIERLSSIKTRVKDEAFELDPGATQPQGAGEKGIDESFSTQAPISLYGSTKLASEIISLEYTETYKFPIWINRCGVLAGAGQFGKPDQGIMSYWINSYLQKKPLKYIGYDGTGYQLRDCLHPDDLAELLLLQMKNPDKAASRLNNVSGGTENTFSLKQLSNWCAKKFGEHTISKDTEPRTFDVPWLVLDSSRVQSEWNWQPQVKLSEIMEQIAEHAESHPGWLELSNA
jgi:CDP-paratose 2-epimerase